jgi:hypothetical protein
MRNDNVRSALAKLQAFYALGRRSLKERPAGRAAHGTRENEQEARRRGVTPYMLRKARVFADSVRGYAPGELRELRALCRQHQTAFGPSHVIALVSIPKAKGQRSAIQQKAIEQGWSRHRLDAEIATRFGTRGEGGRRPIITRRPEDLYAWLDSWCESWRRWHEVLTGDRDPGAKPQLTPDDLPKRLRQLIDDVNRAVWQLHQAVAAELRGLQPGRMERLAFRQAMAERTNGRTTKRTNAKRSKQVSDLR